MRSTLRRAVVGTLAVAGLVGLLAGCTDAPGEDSASPDAGRPTGPPTAGSPTSPTPVPPPGAAPVRAPLGFEVRYVDDDGRFVTVSPEDFPR